MEKAERLELDSFDQPRSLGDDPYELQGTNSFMQSVNTFFLQVGILGKKTLLTLARRRGSTLAYLSSPILVCIVLILLQQLSNGVINQKLPDGGPVQSLDRIPRCQPHLHLECTTLLYAPTNQPWLNDVMRQLAARNQLTFGVDVVPLWNATNSIREDNSTMIDYFVTHPNMTQLALFVHTAYFIPGGGANQTEPPTDVGYVLYTNDTDQYLGALGMNLQRSLDEVILSKRVKKDVQLDVSWKSFPRAVLRVAGYDVVSTNGAQMFFLPPMVVFLLLLVEVTTEKENKLRLGMEMMGLKSSVYWVVWLLTATLLSTLVSLLMILSGYASQFSYFTNTNFFVNFLLFFLFTMAQCALAFFISTLLQRAATAQTLGYGVILLGFIFQSILGSAYGLLVDMLYYEGAAEWVVAMRWGFGFYPPFNMATAFSDIAARATDEIDIEKGAVVKGQGFFWHNLYEKRQVPDLFGLKIDPPPPISSFYLLLLNFVIFFALALLVDFLVPSNGSGFRNPFRYLANCCRGSSARHRVRSSSSSPSSHTNDDDDNDDDDYFGSVPNDEDERTSLLLNADKATVQSSVAQTRNDGVAVRQLHKSYRSCRGANVHAVQGVSITFPRNQITCILGPNGAGKSTLLSVILGLLRGDSGDVDFFGGCALETIRHRVGVCPQHDILFDKLTAREHLMLFGRLKRVREQLTQQVDDMLARVDLSDVADNPVDSFSGGMKRRLSVAIAALGQPLVMVLDECTTGMDPVHRASVWRIIEGLKRDRVVILTTHSMLEADVLGDTVAIMAGGQVQCHDTPIGLKARFGTGWDVRVTNVDRSDAAALADELALVAPRCEFASSGAGLAVTVPRDAAPELVALAEALEQRAGGDGDAQPLDFVVKHSSLEDVFTAVTRAAGFEYADLDELPAAGAVPQHDERGQPSPYRANLLKSFTLQLRQKGTNFCQFLTPVLMILTLVLLQRLINSQIANSGAGDAGDVLTPAFYWPLSTPSAVLEEAASQNGVPLPIPWLGIDDVLDDCVFYMAFADRSGKAGSLSLHRRRVNNTGLLSHIPQYTCRAVGKAASPVASCGDDPGRSGAHLQVPWFRRLNDSAQLDRCVYETTDLFNSFALQKIYDPPQYYYLPDAIVDFHAIETDGASPRLSFTFSVNDNPIWQYHRRNNFTRIHINYGAAKKRGGDKGVIQSIHDHPLVPSFARMTTIDTLSKAFAVELTNTTRDLLKNTNFVGRMPAMRKFDVVAVLHAFGTVLFPIALSLQLPIYIFQLVLEKATGLRAHMACHGMRLLPYYTTQFCFNMIVYLIACSALWTAGALAEIEFFSVTAPSVLIVFFVGWGLSVVSFAFFLSTLIWSPRAASVIGYVVALFGSIVGVVICAGIYGSIQFIGNNQRLPLFLYVYPQFTMVRGVYLLNHSCNHFHACYYELPGSGDELSVVLWALYVSSVFYTALGLLSDVGFRRLAAWRVQRADQLAAVAVDERSVHEESEARSHFNATADSDLAMRKSDELRVISDDGQSLSAALSIERVSKRYPGSKVMAVKDLSFDIRRGETVCLCGANGAGKSTLLSILTGKISPTAGDALVCGASVVHELRRVQQSIGVCTQFDVLWDDLSVEETLLFYARLKGIPWRRETQHVAVLLHELGLFEARHRKPSQLSGGMRRRLSIGVALVGSSQIVFLDEPTTGLDPVSRSAIWRIIERAALRHNTAILLTTHAFDEATRLANRIAIMHKGVLRACGTLDELIADAGRHYILRTSFRDGDGDAVSEAVRSAAPHAQVVRRFDQSATFAIAKSDEKGHVWRFSRLFRTLRASDVILDFSLSDVGLTQVFENIVLENEQHEQFRDAK